MSVIRGQSIKRGEPTYIRPVTSIFTVTTRQARGSHTSGLTVYTGEPGHPHLPTVSFGPSGTLDSRHSLVSLLAQQTFNPRISLETPRSLWSRQSWRAPGAFLCYTTAGSAGAGAASTSLTVCRVRTVSVRVQTWLLSGESSSVCVGVKTDVKVIRSEWNISSVADGKILQVQIKMNSIFV